MTPEQCMGKAAPYALTALMFALTTAFGYAGLGALIYKSRVSDDKNGGGQQ